MKRTKGTPAEGKSVFHVLHRCRALLLTLSAIVVFITSYLLILPALTLEKDVAEEQGGIAVESSAAVETLSYSGKGFEAQVDYSDRASLPEKTSLQVKEISKNTAQYQTYYEKAMKAVQDDAGDKTVSGLSFAKFYDVSLVAEGSEVEPKTPVDVTISYNKGIAAKKAEHVRIIHFKENAQGEEKPEILDSDKMDVTIEKDRMTEASFAADSFSVYAVVYTVDFEYEVDGQQYSYSMEGGSSISLKDLLTLLQVIQDDKDTEADEALLFVEDIQDVTFSSPDLVRADYTDQGWILTSLKPFKSTETLTVTMKNGDVFTVKVTDAQEMNSVDEIDANHSYVILAEANGKYYVLQTDGTTAEYPTSTNIDKLGNSSRWSFYYVFTEKDRETSLDNVYYFIRPIDDKSKTIAFNSENNSLVQKGTNNVAVHDQETGGFVFQGYANQGGNGIKLTLDGNTFRASHDSATVVKIIQQDPLPTYDFTVSSADEAMGTVSVPGAESYEVDGVHYYMTGTDTDKKNTAAITATPVEITDADRRPEGDTPQNKYLFDHWELNGETLYQKDAAGDDIIDEHGKRVPVGTTINPGDLTIPFNAVALKAVFRVNPNYAPEIGEDLGRIVDKESLQRWIHDLETKNLPMNEQGCDKTAEVYDYENRIYRVDLTAEASLWTFAGDIDLGFILDVSGSMQFPSKLYESTDITGTKSKDLKEINNNGTAAAWGLHTDKDYYIIAGPEKTATVCKLFYDGGRWWLCDASKDSTNANNAFYPESGMRRSDGNQKPTATYDQNVTYPIYESGDAVTQDDLNDAKKNAILQKLGIDTVGVPKNRAFYLESSLNGTLSELNTMLKVLSIADTERSENPDVRVAWNTFKNFIPDGPGRNQYAFLSTKGNTIQLNYDKDTYGGGTSTDIAILDAAGVQRSDVKQYDDIYDPNKYGSSNNPVTIDGVEYTGQNKYAKWERSPYNEDITYSKVDGKGFQWENSATKYAVLITDGAPQRSGKDIDDRYVQAAARQLEAQGVKLITVGLSMENVKKGSQLLYNIASVGDDGVKLYYTARSGDELEYVLYDILKTIMDKAAIQGDVVDTISPAFYPVEKNTGKPLKDGDMIDLNGNIVTDASKTHGTIIFNAETDLYSVKWENQNMPAEGWHGSVFVKAKEDLLGGNGLSTNSGNASIDAKSYTLPGIEKVFLLPDERPAITDGDGNPITDEDGKPLGPYNKHLELETPRVNVNELEFDNKNTEWTVYLGTDVDPKKELKELYESIRVHEVVNDAKDTDNDTYSIPDRIDYSNEQSHHYKIRPDDLTDNRERISGETFGEKASFKMEHLILELIQECISKGDTSRSDWASFITTGEGGEPALNWDYFLTEALEEGGITIPYNKYGIGDVPHRITNDQGQTETHYDSSNISITLTKEVVQGEEADIVGHSPHSTTVVSGTEPECSPVEKYTLQILYSPDYDVVPKGQGGKSEEDFHVGIYGAMYQGHAAGTETSENEHDIYVFRKGLQITKTDLQYNTLTGAKFKLYRTARDSDDEASKKTIEGLSGQYVEVAELDTSESGVASIDPISKEWFNLNDGEKYYLVEEETPPGYNTLNPVEVTLNLKDEYITEIGGDWQERDQAPSGAYDWREVATVALSTDYGIKQTDKDGHDITNSSAAAEAEDDIVYYKIPNNPGVELPYTGGSGTRRLRMIGCALVLGAGLFLTLRRRRMCA